MTNSDQLIQSKYYEQLRSCPTSVCVRHQDNGLAKLFHRELYNMKSY